MRPSFAALVAVVAVGPALAQTTQGTQQDPGVSGGSIRQSEYYTPQGDRMRASRLLGAPVGNNADEKIGDVSELVLTKDGKVAAVIVGVGGFLGMGEREVALAFPSVRIEPDDSMTARGGSLVVKTDQTKDTLAKAPAWTWSDGSGTGAKPQPNATTPR